MSAFERSFSSAGISIGERANFHVFLLLVKVQSQINCMEVTVIFPHQLYPLHRISISTQVVILAEHELFFTQFTFHFQKLMLHRASMQAYADELRKRGKDVRVLECQGKSLTSANLFKQLADDKVDEIHLFELNDDWLHRQIVDNSNRMNIRLKWHRGTDFILETSDFSEMAPKEHAYFLHHFYISMRRKYGILLDHAAKPLGGSWSFDAENRKKIPSGLPIPKVAKWKSDSYRKEAFDYVRAFFPNAQGERKELMYPYHRSEALEALKNFCEIKFRFYGDYQDAMIHGESFLFHSVLSPAINIGLLSPDEVLDQAIASALEGEIAINHLEGFVRQILGWREYIRMIYLRSGRRQRTQNALNNRRRIPAAFWKASTGITPLDDAIAKTLKTGYAHHIERLMVIGNFMLLCEFDPDEVYEWFMALYIDAFDWVMVPNVYGMSQFADGGMMSTKPYISGSNYILKMSNYAKGSWTDTWDGLFWRFIDRHRELFLQGGRTNFMISNLNKMPDEKRRKHFENAERFLDFLEKSSM